MNVFFAAFEWITRNSTYRIEARLHPVSGIPCFLVEKVGAHKPSGYGYPDTLRVGYAYAIKQGGVEEGGLCFCLCDAQGVPDTKAYSTTKGEANPVGLSPEIEELAKNSSTHPLFMFG